MNCREMDELLNAFIDGQASAGERRLVARHVEECRACGQKLRLVVGIKASVRKLQAPPAPAALKAALRREAAKRRKAAWSWPALPRWGLAAAFAAAAAVVVFVLAPSREEEVPVDALLAAHSEYALTMPLSPSESIYAGLAERVARGDAHDL